jgi:energy-coupling factor transporter ATP-binding protein EcfA2
MSYDIILGRDNADKEGFGQRGLVHLGKGYVTMGNYTSLSNNIWMDVARSHVVLVAGKRGSGKSYTLGVIAEELASLEPETARNIGTLIFDTMGIFWTMKYKNEKESTLLREWDKDAKTFSLRVFVPYGKKLDYTKKQIPFDETFALKASELEAEDWMSTFNLSMTSQEGVVLQQAITRLKEEKEEFTLKDIQNKVEETPGSTESKNIVAALLNAAATWGVFAPNNEEGTEISSLVKAGETSVLDLSVYSSTATFNVRALVIGLISRKLFEQRTEARKKEEIQSIQHSSLSYTTRDTPLIWLFIDEAHEFLPRDAKTPATDALVQLLREGRQPGISLVLATQQPGQIHRDVMTQSDIVISHRVTSQQDTEALNQIMQSYVLESIKKKMDDLPSAKGSAIILDDNSERLYSMRVRPRFTWHGGESPAAVKKESTF